MSLPARALALHAARLCLEKNALEVRVLALPEGSALFDFVVLATGRSDRQAQAAADEILRFCKERKVRHLPVEGGSGWMVLDCWDVVVHCCTAEIRERYLLDTLWKQARDLDLDREIPALATPGAGV